MYFRYDAGRQRPGALFGVGLMGVFLTRIFLEFLKTVQVDFEMNMLFSMGQWLSVPFVILGVVILYKTYKPNKNK